MGGALNGYAGFCEGLCRRALGMGFQLAGNAAGLLTDTPFFTLYKVEGTALCLLHLLDLTRLDAETLRFIRDKEMARALTLVEHHSSVISVFLQVGPPPLAEATAEAYHGQSPYAVYWYANPETGDFSAAEGQPTDIFGLGGAVRAALAPGEALTDSAEALTFDALSQEAAVPVPPRRFALGTALLVAANLLVMGLMYWQGYATDPTRVALHFGAISPYLVMVQGEYYRLFTAMFVHFGWSHLLFNVAGLLIFGTRVERYFGRGFFLLIYLFSGLVASFASLLLTHGFNPEALSVSAGASGAVYGLVGAAFAFTKYLGKPMDMINNQVVLVYIVMGLVFGFVMPNVDYWGHIGGLIAGALAGLGALVVRRRLKLS